MVVEILIPQRQPEHTLRNQIQQRVLDLLDAAVVGEASGEPPHNPGPLFQLPQQQRSPVGGDVAPVKAPNQFSPSQVLRLLRRLSERLELSRSMERRDH
jgi:hypothetical protein